MFYRRDIIKGTVCSIVALGAVAAGFVATGAFAQGYPSSPVRLISPWPAGGPADAIGQPLADRLSQALGQPVVFEHHPGSNGTIATNLVANAKPDGYTLLLSHAGPTAISPAVQDTLQYDSVEDFAHIVRVAEGPVLFAARGDLPIDSIPELIEYAKENPGDLTYGSVGIGSTVHLAGELFKLEAGIDLLHVPYTGFAPNVADILGGRIDLTILGIGPLLPHIESGDIKPLAVSTGERSTLLPDVPGMADALPGYDVSTWYGLAAPSGTPDDIINLLASTVDEIFQDEKLSARIQTGSGMATVTGDSPAAHSQRIKEEIEQWRRVVEEAGIVAE